MKDNRAECESAVSHLMEAVDCLEEANEKLEDEEGMEYVGYESMNACILSLKNLVEDRRDMDD